MVKTDPDSSTHSILFLPPRSGAQLMLNLVGSDSSGRRSVHILLPEQNRRFDPWREAWMAEPDGDYLPTIPMGIATYKIQAHKRLPSAGPEHDLLVVHAETWPQEWPKPIGQIAGIIRDGRNSVASHYIRPNLDNRRRDDPRELFQQQCEIWRDLAQGTIKNQALEYCHISRFEDLAIDPPSEFQKILLHFGWKTDLPLCRLKYESLEEEKFAERHSSFRSRTGHNTRWYRWELWMREMFCEIAGKELIDLGYEPDDTWVNRDFVKTGTCQWPHVSCSSKAWGWRTHYGTPAPSYTHYTLCSEHLQAWDEALL